MPIAQLSIMAGWAEQPQGWPGRDPGTPTSSSSSPVIGVARRRVFNLNRVTNMNTQSQGEHAPNAFIFENHQLQVIIDEHGELWFIAKQVAEILDYGDTFEMTKKLDDDE
jgi:hypothetical protein